MLHLLWSLNQLTLKEVIPAHEMMDSCCAAAIPGGVEMWFRRFGDSRRRTMPELTIRKDRTPVMLRKLAKAAEDARVARRMLAIANALDGMSRKAAAEAAGMDRQTLRDWVIRYNEDGIDGLLDRWGSGRPPRLEPDELAELYAIVMAGPDPEIDGICAFTREDLVRICEQRFDKTMHRATMGRLLRSIGLSRQKARPSHPQKDPASQEAFKKSPPTPEKTSAYA